jgi:hypothetical protein
MKSAFARASITISIFGLVAAFGSVSCGDSARAAFARRSSGHPATFDLPSDGGLLVTVPLRGKRTTVLYAWAPSCEPCRRSAPELVARRQDIERAGASLVLVAILSDGESAESARRTLESWGVSYPFLVDRASVLQRELGIESIPRTILLTAAGDPWLSPLHATVDDVVESLD